MSDFAHSAKAQQARIVKADAIANQVIASAGPWPDTDHDRRLVEKIAGVRPSSEETWALARSFYDDLRSSRARAAS